MDESVNGALGSLPRKLVLVFSWSQVFPAHYSNKKPIDVGLINKIVIELIRLRSRDELQISIQHLLELFINIIE